MSFSSKIKEELIEYSLLRHPFYNEWAEGKLKKETIKEYAAQYFHHVNAFPRYVSATHSKCLINKDRRVLLENLNDEEGFRGKPHVDLWMQFAQALGAGKDEVSNKEACFSIKEIIKTFLNNANLSYEEGIASFYAYESQIPEIAETKIEGLTKHYSIDSKEALEFFNVHKKADVVHRVECEKLLDKISNDMQEKALTAAKLSAKSLWSFLDEMHQLDKAS